MGLLLHSCVEMCEPIQLSFGMVTAVGPGVGELGGGPCASRESGRFWGCLPPLTEWFQWPIFEESCYIGLKLASAPAVPKFLC